MNLFSLLRHLLCFFFTLLGLQTAFATDPELTGIRNEIIRLGGEWEGQSPPKRIAFVGERFGDRHFELLKRVDMIEILDLLDVTIDATRSQGIVSLNNLRQLQVQQGSLILTPGIDLSTLTKLESVELIDCKVNLSALEAIATAPKLRRISLIDVVLPKQSLRKLVSLKELKRLKITVTAEEEALFDDIAEIKRQLPKCEIEILASVEKK